MPVTQEIATFDGNQITLSEDDISELEATIRGPLLRPADDGYDAARCLWNGMIDKRPAMIACCTGTADVVAAVNFARQRDLLVAVRGGGHNVAGNASCDGGLVIDLSSMKEIQVDPEARTARVQPGVNWGELDRETQRHALATPGGQVSTTGIAGFTLAGGMGFLRRKWGLACDNLRSAEVVTASGEVLRASDSENPDLYWALRGGGGNFGVVTWFEFDLHPLGPEIYGNLTIYSAEEAASVTRGWRDFIVGAPDEVTSGLMLWGMPPFPEVPEEMHWAPVAIVAGMYAGPPEEGEEAFRPVRELGTPLGDQSGPRPYVEMQSDLDPLFADGQLYYWKSLFADHLSDEVIDATVERFAGRPSPQTLFALRWLGGAMGHMPEDATAYANRSAVVNISLDSTWQDPEQSDEMIAWTREAWSDLRDLTGGGVYLNFAGFGEENDELARAGYGENYARLQEVKRRYDPANMFCGNINIVP